VLGRIENLEVLLHPGLLTLAFDQLVVGHSESRRRVHVIHIFIVQKGARLANQRIDHMAKVNRFFAVSKRARHPLKTLVSVPQFKVILLNSHLHLQADILAAHGVGVPLDAQDAVWLHGQRHDSERAQALRWQRPEGGTFFTKGYGTQCVSPGNQFLDKGHQVLCAGKVPTSAKT